MERKGKAGSSAGDVQYYELFIAYRLLTHMLIRFDRIFNFKFLPPGRGLWAMGSSLTEERGKVHTRTSPDQKLTTLVHRYLRCPEQLRIRINTHQGGHESLETLLLSNGCFHVGSWSGIRYACSTAEHSADKAIGE